MEREPGYYWLNTTTLGWRIVRWVKGYYPHPSYWRACNYFPRDDEIVEVGPRTPSP